MIDASIWWMYLAKHLDQNLVTQVQLFSPPLFPPAWYLKKMSCKQWWWHSKHWALPSNSDPVIQVHPNLTGKLRTHTRNDGFFCRKKDPNKGPLRARLQHKLKLFVCIVCAKDKQGVAVTEMQFPQFWCLFIIGQPHSCKQENLTNPGLCPYIESQNK